MELVTLDFETYFDNDYTLSKMTTEEYIRDPRFKVHCVGIKRQNALDTRAQVCNDIGGEGYNSLALLAHHAHFDGLILSHHYNIKPAFWFDTLSMARLVLPRAKSHSLGALSEELGLGAKTIDYASFKGVRNLSPEQYAQVAAGCRDDVELTYKIFCKLLPYIPKPELRVIDMTVRMFTEPVLVLDRPLMEWYVDALGRKKEEKLAQLGVTAKDLASNEKFAAILRQLGVEPPMKPSPTAKLVAGKQPQIYAFAKTDEGFRALLDDEDETVALLAEARLETKSTGTQTRAQRLLGMDARGPLPVYLNYAGAHTLRDSGGDSMNWQNFKRIDFGPDSKPIEGVGQRGTVRLAIKAPPGQVLCVVDASQIECRLLNWLAGQEDVLDAFKTGRDLYSEGASRFYGRQITKADKVERHLGKALELGCGYGMGAEKFQLTCRRGALGGPPIILNIDEAKQAVVSYRSSHPRVHHLWKEADQVLRSLYGETNPLVQWRGFEISNRCLYGPDGTWLDFTHLQWDPADKEWYVLGRRGRSKMYGAKLVENAIQYLARAFIMEKARLVNEMYKIVMRTHDELVYLAPKKDAEQALRFGLTAMRTAPEWCRGIPLDAEGGYDVRYSK